MNAPRMVPTEDEDPVREEVDFATSLFTGDLFGELPGALPILTLDIPAQPSREESGSTETATASEEVRPVVAPEILPAQTREGDTGPRLYGVNHPAFERVALTHDRVRAKLIVRSDEAPVVGHVVDASISGLLVEAGTKVEFHDDEVDVVLGLAGDLDLKFAGRLVRSTSTSLAIQYFAEDSTLRFRLRFLFEALNQKDAPPWVEVRPRRAQGLREAKFDRETREMALLWSKIVEDFSNRDKHQALLNTCIKAGRLDYALERYRVHKRENRDADVDEYVKQIGTILGFYVLSRNPGDEDDASRVRKRTTMIGILVVLALIALLFAQEMMSRMADTRSKAEQSIRRANSNDEGETESESESEGATALERSE